MNNECDKMKEIKKNWINVNKVLYCQGVYICVWEIIVHSDQEQSVVLVEIENAIYLPNPQINYKHQMIGQGKLNYSIYEVNKAEMHKEKDRV